MAELIKRQHDLTVLKLSLDYGGRTGNELPVRFQLEVSGAAVLTRSVAAGLLGLSIERRQMRPTEPAAVELPDDLALDLARAAIARPDAHAPVWVEFASPSGLLPMLDWEGLLGPAMSVPIVRLPYYAFEPVAGDGPLDVVLCASAPRAKGAAPLEEIVAGVVGTIRSLDPGAAIHVFTDAGAVGALRAALYGQPGVMIHPPPPDDAYPAAERSAAPRETPGAFDNPWLRWIVAALAGRSVDVVHFIGHGYLAGDAGALALAEAPGRNEDRAWARFIGPQSIAALLTRTGAWATGISALPDNASPAGLRLLADGVARLRPGPLFLDDLGAYPPTWSRRGLAYEVLLGLGWSSHWLQPMLGLYCLPLRLEPATRGGGPTDRAVQSILEDCTLAGGEAGRMIGVKAAAPAWVTKSQRYLEASVADLIGDEPETYGSTPTQVGIQNALSFVSDVLARHAVTSAAGEPPDPAGGGEASGAGGGADEEKAR
jgi:hypothetical protein